MEADVIFRWFGWSCKLSLVVGPSSIIDERYFRFNLREL